MLPAWQRNCDKCDPKLVGDGRVCGVRLARLRRHGGCAGRARPRFLAAASARRRRARRPGAAARMTRKRRRLLAIVLGLGLLGAATAMVLAAFNDNLVFFYSPSDLAAKTIGPGHRIRIGGLVENQSLGREADGHSVDFRVTDGKT